VRQPKAQAKNDLVSLGTKLVLANKEVTGRVRGQYNARPPGCSNSDRKAERRKGQQNGGRCLETPRERRASSRRPRPGRPYTVTRRKTGKVSGSQGAAKKIRKGRDEKTPCKAHTTVEVHGTGGGGGRGHPGEEGEPARAYSQGTKRPSLEEDRGEPRAVTVRKTKKREREGRKTLFKRKYLTGLIGAQAQTRYCIEAVWNRGQEVAGGVPGTPW